MEESLRNKKIEERRFLTFYLDNEVYGLEMFRVKEIIGNTDIKTVSEDPDCMKGVINLRGKVLPVVDLRLKFSLSEAECPQETCIIVVEVRVCQSERRSLEGCDLPARKTGMRQQIGIIVDSVSEVLNIMSGEIEETPSFEQGIDTDFIIGLGKVEGKIIVLLDIEKVLSSEEIVEQLTIEKSRSGFYQ
ncbi:MAG: chemotaxis protein CheW [Candidatus Scalindua sp.]